jgi:hypothetical protein
MLNLKRSLSAKILITTGALICLPLIFAAQSLQTKKMRTAAQESLTPTQILESKLDQKVAFVPQTKSALEQLVEIAQHYQIPMGIEWDNRPDFKTGALALGRDATVRELINAVLLQAPNQQMNVEDGIVHITSPAYAADTQNILNLRIEDFRITNENLFYAEDRLRLVIDMTLHPNDYEDGYIGSSGYGPDDVFAVKNISFSGSNLTVRNILDKIALANGNALWVARIGTPEQKATQSKSQAASRTGEQITSPLPWKFIPLRERATGNK